MGLPAGYVFSGLMALRYCFRPGDDWFVRLPGVVHGAAGHY